MEEEQVPSPKEYYLPTSAKSGRTLSPDQRPRKNSFMMAASKQIEKEKDSSDEEDDRNICSQTVHAFADTFTAHGVHYIFDKGSNAVSKLFWVAIVVVAFVLAGIILHTALIEWRDNPILTTVKSTAMPIQDLKYPTIVICGQGTNQISPQAALFQRVLEFNNITNTTGPELLINRESELFLKILELAQAFLDSQFPNEKQDKISSVQLIELMTASSPDALLEAKVAQQGGYDPCKGSYENVNITYSCNEGFVKNPRDGPYCYKKIDDDKEKCNKGQWISFNGDDEIAGFITLLKDGSITLPQIKSWFPLDAHRDDKNLFVFSSNFIPIDKENFLNLTQTRDVFEEFCLKARLPTTESDYLEIQSYDCQSLNFSKVCQEYNNEKIECNANKRRKRQDDEGQGDDGGNNDEEEDVFKKYNSLDLVLNPDLKEERVRAVNLLTTEYKEAYESVNMTAWYQGIFETLWYLKNPCFDIRSVTSQYNGQFSLLKQCKWKGVRIPCSSIFTTFPTDRGMCCAFNMEKADEIFKSGTYVDLVSKLQRNDQKKSFEESALPKWYTDRKEPTAQHGINKGLTLMLDLHSDYITPSSVPEDFHGFIGYVSEGNSFPLTTKNGFAIRPGHENYVSIKATDIETDVGTKSIEAAKRNCLFHDEVQLKMHVNYTQANCKLECAIQYAQKESGINCTPWFFPTNDKPVKMCNPWEAVIFERLMFLEIPDGQCKHCLPDCTGTHYDVSVTVAPFRRCDLKNLGVSYLCNLNNQFLPEPKIWGKQVIEEYASRGPKVPKYIQENVITSQRNHIPIPTPGIVFDHMNSQTDVSYDAYDKDVALVHFYFDSPTVFQYYRERRLTFTGLISQIGGVLGLFLGFSIVSVVELVYWFFFKLFCNVMGGRRRRGNKRPQRNIQGGLDEEQQRKGPFYLTT